jgi:uncharacterized membrane protein
VTAGFLGTGEGGLLDEGAPMRRHRLRDRLPEKFRHLTRSELEHDLFWVVVLLKTINALLEVLGGVVLIFISPETISRVVHGLVRPELAEDPGDILAHFILTYLGHISAASKLFAVLYLLVHGAVKLVIVGALWLRRLWAYPLAGVVFAGFIVYQLIRFAYTFSPAMILLSILDLILIALLPPEYRRVKLEIRRHDGHSGEGV